MTPTDLGAQRSEALLKLYRKDRRRSKLPAQGFNSLVRDGLAAKQAALDGQEPICSLTKKGRRRARRLEAQRDKTLFKLFLENRSRSALPRKAIDSLIHDGLAIEHRYPNGWLGPCKLTKKGHGVQPSSLVKALALMTGLSSPPCPCPKCGSSDSVNYRDLVGWFCMRCNPTYTGVPDRVSH
jgi:hypothetical protein